MSFLLPGLDVESWLRFGFHIWSVWLAAIGNPKLFVDAPPSESVAMEAAEFYIALLCFSVIISAPLILTNKGEFSDKMRIATNALFSVVSLGICALAGDLAFHLFHGAGTFASSLLVAVYGVGPYGPLMTLTSLLIFASLPANLRPYALSMATAQKVGKDALNDPRTNRFLFGLSSLLIMGVVIASYIAFFRCMVFVHRVHGFRAAASVVVSLIMLGIIGKLTGYIQGIIMPPPSEDLPEIQPQQA